MSLIHWAKSFFVSVFSLRMNDKPWTELPFFGLKSIQLIIHGEWTKAGLVWERCYINNVTRWPATFIFLFLAVCSVHSLMKCASPLIRCSTRLIHKVTAPLPLPPPPSLFSLVLLSSSRWWKGSVARVALLRCAPLAPPRLSHSHFPSTSVC